MINSHIDVGQLLIASLIAVVGWLIGRMINRIDARLDKHENVIFELVQDVQYLVGKFDGKRSSGKGD